MSNHLREELESILTESVQKGAWNNDDRARLGRFLNELGKVSEVAQVLGVSKATVRWWLRDESPKDQLRPPPPTDKLKKCRDLIIEKHFRNLLKAPHSEGSSASSFYDVFLRLRGFKEIMERSKFSENLWAFRFGRPFKAGLDQQLFDETANFILENKTNLFFVYREPELDDPEAHIYEAKKSFAGIEQKMKAHPKRDLLFQRIRGVPIKGAEADKLGLVDPWVSFAMAEYNDNGYMKYQRSIDVWIENNLFEGEEEKKLVWLELPAADAVKWKQRRSRILSEALKSSVLP